MVDPKPTSVMNNPAAKQLLSAGMQGFSSKPGGSVAGAAAAIQQVIMTNPEIANFVEELQGNPEGQKELAGAFQEEVGKLPPNEVELTKGDDLYAFIKRAFEIGQQFRMNAASKSAQEKFTSPKELSALFQNALNSMKQEGAAPNQANPVNTANAATPATPSTQNLAAKFADKVRNYDISKSPPGSGFGKAASEAANVGAQVVSAVTKFFKP